MQGVIIINPFRVPSNSVRQAQRLKTEFEARGVPISIVDDGFLRVKIENGKLFCDIKADFIIYLDKDKYLSQALEKQGFRLFNTHSAVRLCDDKVETYIALCDKGLNLPKTIFGALCFRAEREIEDKNADEIIAQLGLPVIVKESFGSLGMNVYKADTRQELLQLMETVKLRPHLFQEYLGYKAGTDVRVIVIGKKAVCAMQRVNENDFRSNVELGGKGVKINLPEEFEIVAQRVAQILDLDYCGIDILYGNNGEPYVCEVNSNAFFEGIELTTGVNVAGLYADYVIEQMNK